MASQKLKEKVFKILLEIEENQVCFDCSSGTSVCVSISNGIFLCPSCAAQHEEQIPEISKIRPISDSFTIEELKSLSLGGNKALANFFNIYKIHPETPVREKYDNEPAQYYRDMILYHLNNRYSTYLHSAVKEEVFYMDEEEDVEDEDEEEEKHENQAYCFSGIMRLTSNLKSSINENYYVQKSTKTVGDLVHSGGRSLQWGASKAWSSLEWSADRTSQLVQWGSGFFANREVDDTKILKPEESEQVDN